MFHSFTLMYEVTVDLLHTAQTGSVSMFLSYSNTDINALLKKGVRNIFCMNIGTLI